MALWLAAAALAAPGLLRLHVDNSPEVFFIRDDPALARQQRLARALGAPAALRVAVGGDGLWTAEGLAWLGRLEIDLARVRGVLGVAGLAGLRRAEAESWPPADPDAARRAALADPLPAAAGWISADGAVTTVLVLLGHLPPDQRRMLLESVRALLDGRPAGVECWTAGLPVVNQALDDGLSKLARALLPAVLLIVLSLLAAALGSLRDLLAPLALVSICLTIVFGLMGHLRPAVDLVTILALPLLFVVGLAAAIHVQLRYRRLLRHRSDDPSRALTETYREKAWPILWSGVTTAAGFSSLLAARVPPIRALGLWCTSGIALVTLALFTLQPALLRLWPARDPRPTRYERRAARAGRRLASWAVAHRTGVAAAFLLISILAAAGANRLRLETSALTYLAPGHPARAGLERLEARGIGAVGVDLVLALPAAGDGGFRRPDRLARLASLTADLRREPGILAALAYPDLAARGVDPPPPANALLRAGRGLALSSDGELARIRLLVPMLGFTRLDPLLDRVVARARRELPAAEIWTGGDYALVLAAQRSLLATMVVSLAITAAIIVLLLFLLLGSGRMALAALLPNLFPVVLVVGAMGWLEIPLDSTTVMIGAIALGLAVDDTLHTFGDYRLDRGPAGAERIARTFERVAPAHVLTSVVLGAGFAACALSEVVPIARFGALSATAVGGALLADLLLVPALIRGLGGAPPGGGPARPPTVSR